MAREDFFFFYWIMWWSINARAYRAHISEAYWSRFGWSWYRCLFIHTHSSSSYPAEDEMNFFFALSLIANAESNIWCDTEFWFRWKSDGVCCVCVTQFRFKDWFCLQMRSSVLSCRRGKTFMFTNFDRQETATSLIFSGFISGVCSSIQSLAWIKWKISANFSDTARVSQYWARLARCRLLLLCILFTRVGCRECHHAPVLAEQAKEKNGKKWNSQAKKKFPFQPFPGTFIGDELAMLPETNSITFHSEKSTENWNLIRNSIDRRARERESCLSRKFNFAWIDFPAQRFQSEEHRIL